MAAARAHQYAQADLAVPVDGRPPATVAEAVLAAILAGGARLAAGRGRGR
jgi:hypothetical protein